MIKSFQFNKSRCLEHLEANSVMCLLFHMDIYFLFLPVAADGIGEGVQARLAAPHWKMLKMVSFYCNIYYILYTIYRSIN